MSLASGGRWKKLFIGLLAVNVLMLAAAALLVLGGGEPAEEPAPRGESGTGVSGLRITAGKDDLSGLINGYLQENLSGGIPALSVRLDDDVRLYGALTAFGREIRLELGFDPFVTESGDLVLEAGSMRIGALPVPVRRALSLIERHFSLPEWVDIAPDESRVYVYLSRIGMRGGLKVKAVAFSPAEDRFEFILYHPAANGRGEGKEY